MTIWGNHSATQYPDLFHAEVGGKNAAEVVGDQAWLENDVHPDRAAARRGDHRGPRRVAARRRPPTPPSTTCRTWLAGTADGRLGVDGGAVRRQLRRARGPHVVVPVHHARTATWEIVQGLDIDDFSRGRIDASVAELAEERDTVKGLGLI